jgi:hypothetical protein
MDRLLRETLGGAPMAAMIAAAILPPVVLRAILYARASHLS